MSAPIDVTQVRLKVSEIVHALGFVIDFCECSIGTSKADEHGWPAGTAEELVNAMDNANDAMAKVGELQAIVETAAHAMKKAARKHARTRARNGGAS